MTLYLLMPSIVTGLNPSVTTQGQQVILHVSKALRITNALIPKKIHQHVLFFKVVLGLFNTGYLLSWRHAYFFTQLNMLLPAKRIFFFFFTVFTCCRLVLFSQGKKMRKNNYRCVVLHTSKCSNVIHNANLSKYNTASNCNVYLSESEL